MYASPGDDKVCSVAAAVRLSHRPHRGVLTNSMEALQGNETYYEIVSTDSFLVQPKIYHTILDALSRTEKFLASASVPQLLESFAAFRQR